MRLFIYELVSAGGLGDDPPPSLQREGWAMLTAVAADFQRVAGGRVVTLLAANRTANQSLGHECRRCRAADGPAAFREAVQTADHALVIAPETDDLLAMRSQEALDGGATLLGCSPVDIRRVADKLRLAHTLFTAGIPAIATWPLSDMPADLPFPRVLKPRIGAGAQATWVAHDDAAWDAAVRAARAELPRGDFVVQPYHPGTPASMALLCGKNAVITTPGAFQRLRIDGRLTYEGGSAPLPSALRQRAESLARKVASATGPLQGYIGIDLILGQTGDGSDDVVVEINPRLTTSYIGLRRLTRTNLAAQWLGLLGLDTGAGDEPVSIEWSQPAQPTVW